jgi:hypothetical protein
LDVQIILSVRLAELEMLVRALDHYVMYQVEVANSEKALPYNRELAAQDVKLAQEVLARLRDRD